ncbi:glycoside hydrolase family protein [Phenylobacterium sp.]|uniref:lysozyme n=1 Tax=Phenylobacterium sp. TaxID=1871053 RepID=UPI00286A272F|nr:glycoside hydrolase family protein [Phenylobacterium sp.]
MIKRFEGYRQNSARLPGGGWTIGYGHTLTAREGASVSESDAEALLLYDLIAVAHAVNEHVFAPLTQNQFDALVGFTFNIGVENFQRSSVLRRLNEGQLLQAACAMELWRKSDFDGERIVVDALVRRRSVEKTLFLTPPGGFVPAPTPILPPNVDMDSMGAVPRQVPTALIVPLSGEHTVIERDETPPAPPAEPDEDDAPTPTQSAAEAVTSRLSTIFAEPPPVETQDDRFALTPPEEDFSREALNRVPPPTPEPVAELEPPSLFDPPLTVANDLDAVETPQAEPEVLTEPEVEVAREAPSELTLETPAQVVDESDATEPKDSPRVEIDPIEADHAIIFPRREVAPAAPIPQLPPLAPAAILAIVGMGIFSGGVLSGVNNLNGLAWIGGVIGIGLFAVAVYLLLDRLGQVAPEDELEDDAHGADDTRDQ